MLSLFAGYNQSLEYAEFEWFVDLGVVVAWVLFAINVLGTILTRKGKILSKIKANTPHLHRDEKT